MGGGMGGMGGMGMGMNPMMMGGMNPMMMGMMNPMMMGGMHGMHGIHHGMHGMMNPMMNPMVWAVWDNNLRQKLKLKHPKMLKNIWKKLKRKNIMKVILWSRRIEED